MKSDKRLIQCGAKTMQSKGPGDSKVRLYSKLHGWVQYKVKDSSKSTTTFGKNSSRTIIPDHCYTCQCSL